MKSMKLNTSAKYKNNKFQIKYLKAKKNDIILFATYSATWNEEDNAFYRAYDFFIYFNRNKRAVCYIGNNCEQRSRANNIKDEYGVISALYLMCKNPHFTELEDAGFKFINMEG